MRINEKDLYIAVKRLNKATGKPKFDFKTEGESYKQCVDAFDLDNDGKGYQLVRICNPGGGVEVISSGGYVPKRELYNQIHTALNILRG